MAEEAAAPGPGQGKDASPAAAAGPAPPAAAPAESAAAATPARAAQRFPKHWARYWRSDYIVLNVVLLSSYALIREHFLDGPVYEGQLFHLDIRDFRSWERYFGFLCAGSAFTRAWRARSADAGIANVLAFAQLFILLMAMVCSRVLLAHLVIGFALVYLIFPQPVYPMHDVLEHLTPEAFLETVRGTAAAAEGSDTVWVVCFHAGFHSGSRKMAAVIAELASRYATDKLRFGAIDLAEFRTFAPKVDIELSPTSGQLPTIALYERGEERARVPKKQAGKLYGHDFRAKDVVRTLELDMRHARSLKKSADKKDK